MDKYVSANKLKAKVISGEPVLFDEATQHEIFFLLELEPSENVKPVVHAHWVPQHPKNRTGKAYTFVCSNCKKFAIRSRQASIDELGYVFCPNCGAKMDEEKKYEIYSDI